MRHLAAIGFGYTAEALARRLQPAEWRVTGTKRAPPDAAEVDAKGYRGLVWNADTSRNAVVAALHDVTHILLSAAPTADGDPIIERLRDVRADCNNLQWIGYLSTIGVYGDHDGAWVDEETPARPSSERGKRRLLAESAWQEFGAKHSVTAQVFRLPGIYGPGRSAFDKLKAGTSRRINKPGQVFNRMHVDDIAGALEQAMTADTAAHRIYNLADDLPAPPQDVIAYAAELMGIEPPPETAFDTADMTPMARSFYGDNKRVSNNRMKTDLGYQPQYPSYREGFDAIWHVENALKRGVL